MKLIQSEKTVVTLANAGELVANIARGVLGNEVADTIGGSPVTRDTIYDMAMTQAQAATAPYTKGQ